MADPLQFVDIYGAQGIGLICNDTVTASATDRKQAANDAIIELSSIKGKWRLGNTTYTSGTSPALVAGTFQYNLPSDFDNIFRAYYREAGRVYDIKVVSDSEWLERSTTRSTDAGDPRFARITSASATVDQIELDKPTSATFITRINLITVEYWKEIARLTGDTDELILPANLRHHAIYYGSWLYAITQGDFPLADRLERRATDGKAAVLRHDITRTGRPRQLRPSNSQGRRVGLHDYGRL